MNKTYLPKPNSKPTTDLLTNPEDPESSSVGVQCWTTHKVETWEVAKDESSGEVRSVGKSSRVEGVQVTEAPVLSREAKDWII